MFLYYTICLLASLFINKIYTGPAGSAQQSGKIELVIGLPASVIGINEFKIYTCLVYISVPFAFINL